MTYSRLPWVEHEEEIDDFGFTLRTSTARLHHSLRYEAYNVVPIGILVPNSLQVANRRSQLAGVDAGYANSVRTQANQLALRNAQLARKPV